MIKSRAAPTFASWDAGTAAAGGGWTGGGGSSVGGGGGIGGRVRTRGGGAGGSVRCCDNASRIRPNSVFLAPGLLAAAFPTTAFIETCGA